ncbi:hypothetical protein AAFF_G00393460 [Aldrovandia affinis]|uniref:Uncharacterized protein n=1 Tax=Aldrovandia affinis TaxID=143900 RepID=A0AAD7SDI0_9TELE|nr:hypothetical protein AAFF_G00393460 [Aldrovandia affinis]
MHPRAQEDWHHSLRSTRHPQPAESRVIGYAVEDHADAAGCLIGESGGNRSMVSTSYVPVAPPSAGGHQRGTLRAVDTTSHVHPAVGQQVDADEACGTIFARLTCKLLQEWRCAVQVVNRTWCRTTTAAHCPATFLVMPNNRSWASCVLNSPCALRECSTTSEATTGTITTQQQELKIQAFADFITHIYATWWLACDTAIDDLTLYHHMYTHKSVGAGITASAIKALEWHLWYLMGEMLPLALFRTKMPVSTCVMHLRTPSRSTSQLISTCEPHSCALALASAS